MEIVGEIIFYKKEIYYKTTRDMLRGEIFSKKNYFQGIYMPLGIAIDVAILKKLFAGDIKGIIFLIKNLETKSFCGKIDLLEFMEKSVINSITKYWK